MAIDGICQQCGALLPARPPRPGPAPIYCTDCLAERRRASWRRREAERLLDPAYRERRNAARRKGPLSRSAVQRIQAIVRGDAT